MHFTLINGVLYQPVYKVSVYLFCLSLQLTATRLIVHQFLALIRFLLTLPMVSVAELVHQVGNRCITHKVRQVCTYIWKTFLLYELRIPSYI